MDTLAKMSQKILHIFSEHAKHFFLENNLHFLAAGGGVDSPPPLGNTSAKNAFFYVLPNR